jgi:predicted small secreted protein
MDDNYLKIHYVVGFFLFLFMGIIMTIFFVKQYQKYRKRGWESIKENSLSVQQYFKSISGIFLGISIVIMSVYFLIQDIKEAKTDNTESKYDYVTVIKDSKFPDSSNSDHKKSNIKSIK